MKRKKFGIVLRTHALKESDVEERVRMTRETVEIAQAIQIEGWNVFSQTDVMVWMDPRYNGRTDYTGRSDFSAGLSEEERRSKGTAAALRAALDPLHVRVHEVTNGDMCCTMLNYAVATQLRDHIDYSLILSPDARSYLNEKVMRQMIEAMEHGALAAGLAIRELTESVLKGRLANTFCLWDSMALMSVGGFDLRAAPTYDPKRGEWALGWSKLEEERTGNGEVYYPMSNVEEVIPLARLVEVYGRPCIAPILPAGEGHYQVPDPTTQPELWEHHVRKFGTKFQRQVGVLALAGFSLDHLKGGVMPQYRT